MKLDTQARVKIEVAPPAPPEEPRIDALESLGFHQLVSVMEARRDDAPRVGSIGNPAGEYLRFRASRSRSFEAREVAETRLLDDGDRLEVRVNFFGLYGPASPLPPDYTERILEAGEAPSAVEDFLDLFNHRLISLLHVIWRNHRHDLAYKSGASDPLSRRFLALCGLPVDDHAEGGPMAPAALLAHAGLMSVASGSAEVVAGLISDYFGIPCRIEEFVPRQVTMDKESRLGLGRSNTILSEDAVLGSRIEDDLGKFRVCLGPAPFDALAPFFPGEARHQALCQILAMKCREPLDWDLSFDCEPDTVPIARLGEARLGRSSWLGANGSGEMQNPVILATAADGDPTSEPAAGSAYQDSSRPNGLQAWS